MEVYWQVYAVKYEWMGVIRGLDIFTFLGQFFSERVNNKILSTGSTFHPNKNLRAIFEFEPATARVWGENLPLCYLLVIDPHPSY